MTARNISVTLSPGYLARDVSPVVAKAPGYAKRRWRLYGEDSGGARFPLLVDGYQPAFPTRREARAYLDSLALGDDARIWATPAEARPVPPVIPTSAVRGRYGFAIGGAEFVGART